jgi:hypothetical protein
MQVSERELIAVKEAMDRVFTQNAIKPGHPSYQYDIQRDFEPTGLADNDWDSNSSTCN